MMRTVVLFIFFGLTFLVPHTSAGQGKGKNIYKVLRMEYQFGAGVSNYLGELGGQDGVGKNWSPSDLEAAFFRPAFNVGVRYNLNHRFSLRGDAGWLRVRGNDTRTQNPQRNYRNLSFRSTIIEFTAVGEIHIIRANYKRKLSRGAMGGSSNRIGVIAYAGFGFFYYNPKRGATPLRPLSTEGQGIGGAMSSTYGLFAANTPYGLEVNYIVTSVIKLGLDVNYRFTTTDYLDDASTVYFDNDIIRKNKGDLAAELADRTNGERPTWSVPGSPRGNPESKDTYFSIMVKFTYAPFSRSSTRKRNRARF